jgi:hypothetical protein
MRLVGLCALGMERGAGAAMEMGIGWGGEEEGGEEHEEEARDGGEGERGLGEHDGT